MKFFRLCFGLSNASVKSIDELKSISIDYLSTIGNPNFKIDLELNISTPKIFKFVMPAIMMMADVIIKGGNIIVKETETALKICVNSDSNLNVSKLKNIDDILKGIEVNENISSFAPLFYLLEYTKSSKINVYLNESTLVIGE